jgi:hypothetical protein
MNSSVFVPASLGTTSNSASRFVFPVFTAQAKVLARIHPGRVWFKAFSRIRRSLLGEHPGQVLVLLLQQADFAA